MKTKCHFMPLLNMLLVTKIKSNKFIFTSVFAFKFIISFQNHYIEIGANHLKYLIQQTRELWAFSLVKNMY